MKYKPVKVAVIGCGMISDIYLENLKNKFYITELVGCSDIVDEKAQRQADKYGIRKMTNHEILNDPQIELVVNLTYACAHYEVNRAILNAGKHCYSEKMMCTTMEEADELNRIRKKNHLLFAAAPDTFLGAGMQTARYIVDSGLIGEPIQAVATLTRGYHMIKSDADDAVRKYSVMYEGGGIPYDMGGYYLHALFHILGPVESVCGYAETKNAKRPYLNPRHSKFDEPFTVNTPNTLSSVMKFKNGVFGSVNISSEYDTVKNEFKLYGTRGILSLGDPNLFGDSVILEKNETSTQIPLYFPYKTNSRGIGVADMAWALRTSRPPRISFEMGYHALEIINAVIECSRDREVKLLSTEFERPVPLGADLYPGGAEERSLFVYSETQKLFYKTEG